MNNFYMRWASSTWFGLLYQKKYSAEWDAALNRLIDKHWQSVKVDRYTATLGGVEVWISNAFYAYGTHYRAEFEVRPSVKTMRRLDSLVIHAQQKIQEQKKAAYESTLKELGR